LESHKCEYVVIRGVAAVLHGIPRATFDLDILIEATPENAERLLEALADAGLGTASLVTPGELLSNEITIFQDRVRLDVQTSTPGLTYDAARQRRLRMEYQGQAFYIVSREDLIASASGWKADRFGGCSRIGRQMRN
jgi:hypothetical protein